MFVKTKVLLLYNSNVININGNNINININYKEDLALVSRAFC